MKYLILALALVVVQHSVAVGIEVWEGPGTLFDLKGNPTATYNLVVERTKNGNQIQSHVTVTLSDGKIIKHQCVTTEVSPDSWTSKCDHGQGGGHCLGEGMCIAYEQDELGRAFATTIAMDGPSDMRLLRTELKDGQAVQFFREKLHKKSL